MFSVSILLTAIALWQSVVASVESDRVVWSALKLQIVENKVVV